MENSDKHTDSASKAGHDNSRSVLESFFINSLKEMFAAEAAISDDFNAIKAQVKTKKLKHVLEIHYAIHLKHKDRLEKIFHLKNIPLEKKECDVLNALLTEAKSHLNIFANDIANWEIALILVSQKLAYYKIATYGGLAHLAINLNYYEAATLLAISVQEEEEFTVNHLNGFFDEFLSSHVEGYKC